ncbi:sigma-70 family RNA polymerase sigma factor [Paenibacillus antarcticus]|uniref:RNA polymerase subunit sigma-70 n=1 Tax=Paenibacillus antarcticus TaxID=253703 RepID=A0A168MN23_9BACL|nr:sigma-70 family RNA polymerase sigma factor [Paenibacillus antarcticus]OAB44863.1 RNA polymerase subunit sigma-70 [Paenibacillus antarcticus]
MEVTENNVVQQIQNRNEKAISFIIYEYGGLLAAIIKRHLNYQQQDYEECLDDVLLSVLNHIHSFSSEKNSFKQWLAAIAKYKAIDYQRRQIVVHNQQFSVSEMDKLNLQANQPSETICVDELLEQLSVSEREIFEKYYLEGISSSEIAKKFNAKESWVYNKLSRGRKKLKKMMVKNNES